jgi:hypothetical protein
MELSHSAAASVIPLSAPAARLLVILAAAVVGGSVAGGAGQVPLGALPKEEKKSQVTSSVNKNQQR